MSGSAKDNAPKCVVKGCEKKTRNLGKVCSKCLDKAPWSKPGSKIPPPWLKGAR